MLASCKELPHYNLSLQHMPAPKKSQRHPSLEDAVIYSKTILCPEGQKRAHTRSAGQKSSQRLLKDVSHLSTNTGAFAFVGQELFCYREKGSKSDFWSDLFC